jgi:hypothetical protein
MTSTSLIRGLLFLVALLGLALFAASPVEAQDLKGAGAKTPSGFPNAYYTPPGPRRAGGYSLTLSDIWGPAKMPPAPKDFGPHFDFPPAYDLNGAPNHSPYPN